MSLDICSRTVARLDCATTATVLAVLLCRRSSDLQTTTRARDRSPTVPFGIRSSQAPSPTRPVLSASSKLELDARKLVGTAIARRPSEKRKWPSTCHERKPAASRFTAHSMPSLHGPLQSQSCGAGHHLIPTIWSAHPHRSGRPIRNPAETYILPSPSANGQSVQSQCAVAGPLIYWRTKVRSEAHTRLPSPPTVSWYHQSSHS